MGTVEVQKVMHASTDRSRIACLTCGTAGDDDLRTFFFPQFDWPRNRTVLRHDWSRDRQILDGLSTCSGVVLRGFNLTDLDTLFRLRALQLLRSEPCLAVPSIVFVTNRKNCDGITPGLYHRVASSWPFRSVVFVAEGAAAAALSAERLPVLSPEQARQLGANGAMQHPDALVSHAGADQAIGIQIQPMWSRCGSSTAFANEIDCLIQQGLFTLRIYVDHDRLYGETTMRYLAKIVPQNTLDSGPCLETLACSEPDISWWLNPPRPPSAAPTPRAGVAAGLARLLSRVRALRPSMNEYEQFWSAVYMRTHAVIQDEIGQKLAARAKLAIVNHATTIGFAMTACPDARLVLDTHDYLSRGALERARSEKSKRLFPNCRSLRDHVALENRLWQAADVCTTVSESEAERIRRRAAQCLLVLPDPYAKPWRDPGAEARWDLLLVADNHFFNYNSVSWFLEEVVGPSPHLRALRIAIVGKVRERLESRWSDRLSNVIWLGYVRDLDELRLNSRLAVCPDRGGTGIAVKALTALAAGQPIVATSVALRGLPANIRQALPVSDTAPAMADDIIDLLAVPSRLAARHESVSRAYASLKRASSFAAAVERAATRSELTAKARRRIFAEFGTPRPNDSDAIWPYTDRKRSNLFSRRSYRISLGTGGNATPYLGAGWHEPERWGRFMDGKHASFHLPSAWFSERTIVEIAFRRINRKTHITVACAGRVLSPAGLSTWDRTVSVRLDASNQNSGNRTIVLDVFAQSTFCQNDKDCGSDERVLGAGVTAVRILQPSGSMWREVAMGW